LPSKERSFLWEVLITEALRLVAQDNGRGKRAKCEEFLAESIPRSTPGFQVDESCKVERDGGHRGKGTYTPDITLRHQGRVLNIEVKSPDEVTAERLVTPGRESSSRLLVGSVPVHALDLATGKGFNAGADVGVSVVPLTSSAEVLAVRTRASKEKGKALQIFLPERPQEWDCLQFLLRQDLDGPRAHRQWPPPLAIDGLVDWTIRDSLTRLQNKNKKNFMWTEAPGLPYFLRRPEYAEAFLEFFSIYCSNQLIKFRAALGKCHALTGETDCRTTEEEVRNSQSVSQDICNSELRAYCAEFGTPSMGE
jgi:hypothetical protein